MDEPDRRSQISSIFLSLANSIAPGAGVIDTMHALVEAATNVPGVDEAGIVLADSSGKLHVMATTSERATDLEEVQLGVHAGPCMEAFETGELVEITDVSTVESRWPDFATAAQSRGFTAAHAVPLRLRGNVFGAMNLFSTSGGPLDEEAAALAQALADTATIGVVHHRVVTTSEERAERADHLQKALDSRVVIEQAKGVLSELHRMPVDEAFAALRNYSRAHNARLTDVAERIVDRTLKI